MDLPFSYDQRLNVSKCGYYICVVLSMLLANKSQKWEQSNIPETIWAEYNWIT